MSSNKTEKDVQYFNSADIPAPPYPGPPLDHNVAPQHGAQHVAQPVAQYPPQPVHQTVIHAVHQPANNMVVVQRLPTEVPGQMFCPHCQNSVVTTVTYRVGLFAWMICGILGAFLKDVGEGRQSNHTEM
ncbi:unnamed protein product [Menidia menidia]|uniref:(Atlantic silverside) hypothetical protein n=1 Tax=Menidia menidia TaxID=238744 RepID=A0A8S4B3T3_9TELE|nr:unnamed protein product [Menidia menidia]